MKFAIIQLAEYAHVLGASFLGALLFPRRLGRPGPGVARSALVPLKALFVFLVFTWIRWSFVRIRAIRSCACRGS
jgi:NADH:ubiquinone oxidoreductase subunit H